jgi:ribosome-binding factor A
VKRGRSDRRDATRATRIRPAAVAPAAGPSQRQLRAGELIRRALIEALGEAHFRDPDLVDASITVSEVRVSPDLEHATAFVMPLGGREAEKVLAALKRARAFMRGEVARRVALRQAPEIHFALDRSYEEGARIDALLRVAKTRDDADG